MHSFRLLLLIGSLFLGLVACKESNSSETTTSMVDTTAQQAAVPIDSVAANVLKTNKEEALKTIVGLNTILTDLLAKTEPLLASAKDERTRKELQGKINFYKEYQSDLQELVIKINESDIEGWSAVSVELEGYHQKIKMSAQSVSENTMGGSK